MVKAGLYLPDTNVLIYALSGVKPYSGWLEKWIRNNKLVLSSIVIAEFLSGATKNEEKYFKVLLERFKILPVDENVAQVAAGYKRKFGKKSKKIWLSDCLIAATCKVFGAVLVTADRRDYPMRDILIDII